MMNDKEFLKNHEAFDSEIDAAIYPLPKFVYKVIKILVDIKSPLFPCITSNAISLLLAFAFSRIKREPKNSDHQIKYFSMACRLLNTVKEDVSQKSNPERALKWSPYLKGICENSFLMELNDAHFTSPDFKFSEIDKAEHLKIYMEVLHEWY
jgi:hypothetical protein